MQIYSNQLNAELQKGIAPLYIISSDEPFWHSDASSAIIANAKSKGFTNYVYSSFSDDSVNLEQLADTCSSPGLFAERVIVVLTVNSLKSKNGKEAMNIISQSLNPTLLPIITLPRLSKSELGPKKFYGALANKGLLTIFYPLKDNEFINFIIARANKYGLTLNAEGAAMIQSAYQGNMFALVQTLEKLSLAGYKGYVPPEEIRENISSGNHFSIFDLIDAFVDASVQPSKRLTMLSSLKGEGYSATELVTQVGNAFTDLIKMRMILDSGAPLNDFFDKHRLLKALKTKRPIYQHGAETLTLSQLRKMINLVCEADIKARSFDDEGALMILQELAIARSYPNKCNLSE